jgi:hypothetical protein
MSDPGGGEDPDGPGPASDLLVHALDGVGRVQSGPMLAGEVQMRQHVLGRVLEQLGGLWEPGRQQPMATSCGRQAGPQC